MRKVTKAHDVDGRDVKKGDTVATLSGNMTGKVYDIALDAGMAFLCLRPLHHPFSRGVWHSADHVQRIATAKAK